MIKVMVMSKDVIECNRHLFTDEELVKMGKKPRQEQWEVK